MPPYIKELGERRPAKEEGTPRGESYSHRAPIAHIFYEDLYRSNRITTYVVPFFISMLLD